MQKFFLPSNTFPEISKFQYKSIYDKPDNDVNDDGVYAFGPFPGNTKLEFARFQRAFNISRAVKATPDDNEIHNDLFLSRACDRYKETYSIVEQHGDLTERGQQIFDEMKTQVDKCLN